MAKPKSLNITVENTRRFPLVLLYFKPGEDLPTEQRIEPGQRLELEVCYELGGASIDAGHPAGVPSKVIRQQPLMVRVKSPARVWTCWSPAPNLEGADGGELHIVRHQDLQAYLRIRRI